MRSCGVQDLCEAFLAFLHILYLSVFGAIDEVGKQEHLRPSAPDWSMEVAMLESTLANCVVFHDHFSQAGQHPILVLTRYHVHPNLCEEGADEAAASFLVLNLLKPRPNVAASTLPSALHPPSGRKNSLMIETNSKLTNVPATCLVPIGHHHQHVPSLLHCIWRVFI